MQKEQCEPVSNPFARSMCNDPRSQSSPCLSNSGTETVRSYGEEEHNQPIKFPWADSAHSVLSFITWNNACWLQSSSTYSTSTSSEEGRQSVEPSLRGEGTAGRASEPRERALDLMGKEEDKDSPVFVPTTWSICDSNESSQRSALFSAKRAGTVKNAGEGSYSKNASESEHAVSLFIFTRAVSSLESWNRLLCSQADNTQTVCISSRESFSFAGRNTQPVMRSALAKC